MYVATVTYPVGPDHGPCAPMREMLDTGGAEFVGVLSGFDEIVWRGVTVRDVLTAVPKSYGEYCKGLHSHDEAARWREVFYKLRNKLREQIETVESGEIAGSQVPTPKSICGLEKFCARVPMSKTFVASLRPLGTLSLRCGAISKFRNNVSR